MFLNILHLGITHQSPAINVFHTGKKGEKIIALLFFCYSIRHHSIHVYTLHPLEGLKKGLVLIKGIAVSHASEIVSDRTMETIAFNTPMVFR